jgi:hypothetical protein
MAERGDSEAKTGDGAPEWEVGPAKRPRRAPLLRWYILTGLLVPFTILTYLAVGSGSPGDVRSRPVFLATMATITGPFVGAIARGGQSCCLSASVQIAIVCGPVLAVGVLSQFIPMPFRRGREAARLVLWTVGWLAWLLGGFVSFFHALS